MAEAAAPSGLADAISRWQRRERDRELHSADRAVLAAQEADPREATDVFLARHAREKAAAEALVGAVKGDKSGETPARDAIMGLQQGLAEASYWLPQFDLRRLTAELTDMSGALEETLRASGPRRRFAFAPTPEPAGTVEQSATPAAQAAEGEPPPPASAAALQGATPAQPPHRPSTLHFNSSTLPSGSPLVVSGEEVSLTGLRDQAIMLLGCPAALYIDDLERCSVTAGPVAGACLIEGARACTFNLAAHQVRIHASHDTRFHLRSSSAPIIEHSSGLGFGPLQTSSGPGPSQEDLEGHGLGEDAGHWARVLDFDWIKSTPSPNWALL
uniref:C-CAP/cofactor C-like domain-containing protein n=1 Tax=Auxenochlorella protothecoides TaxID=3075 RepID=A0A1D2A971_AUXPR